MLLILTNKDDLFNADVNANITANNAVLGQEIHYNSNFGISTNPESFAHYAGTKYFADANRGTIMKLTKTSMNE